MRTRTAHFIGVAVLIAALGLAACGDDDDDGSSGGGSEDSSAGGGGAYGGGAGSNEQASGGGGTTLALSAKAGKVTVVMKNPSSATAPHAVEIEGQGVEKESDVVQPGGTARVTATLKPGEYEFYCPVGDHAEEGMEGTLTVN